MGPTPGHAATQGELEQDAKAGHDRLYAKAPSVLFEPGQAPTYNNTSAASFGFQAGAQTFGYALFFITPSSLDFLHKSQGWSIGFGASVVVLDQGKAKSMTSTTLTQDVYALAFGQYGLMAGAGIEGSKITQIYPSA